MTELASRRSESHASGIAVLNRLAVVVPLGLVVVAIVAALFLVGGVESQLSDVTVAQQVRQEARDLLQGLVDSESGQRGYLLTQNNSYLTPYRAADETIDSSYSALLNLVRDNSDVYSTLMALKPDITAKREEMASTIAMVEAGRVGDAIQVVNSDTGKALMDRIRSSIGAFVSQEDGWLAGRNAEVATYRQGLVVAIIAALVGASALVVVLFTRGQQRVTDLSRRQSALIEQTQRLEALVHERTADLEESRKHAERERARVETLLQDTSHRIGNSLATVSSLLGLQVTRTKSPAVRSELEAAQSRVHAIASGYRRLRLGADLETVDVGEFLESVVDDLATTSAAASPVTLSKDIEHLVIPARDATSIGIIVNELVINAVKHAFAADAAGEIKVSLQRGKDGVVGLSVEDNGRGIPSEKPESGLGALIIRQLARQFGGEPHYAARAGGGTVVLVPLPELKTADSD